MDSSSDMFSLKILVITPTCITLQNAKGGCHKMQVGDWHIHISLIRNKLSEQRLCNLADGLWLVPAQD